MYADPTHIRNRRVNLSLNEVEARLVDTVAELNGMQTSAFLRGLILEGLRVHAVDFADGQQEKRHANA